MNTKQVGMAVIAGALLTSGFVTMTQATPAEAATSKTKKADTVKKSKEVVKSEEALQKVKIHLKKNKLTKPFAIPVKGQITSEHGSKLSPFGRGEVFHRGIDIAAKKGTAVKASYTGKVLEVKYEENGRGNYIVLEHNVAGKKFKTLYAHMDKSNVKVGQNVNKGHAIGHVGSTGRSTGAHLHFEIMDESNVTIDPKEVME